MISDAELKALLNRGGIGETLYEGEIGERNMKTWHKLFDVFKDHYDLQEYSKKCNKMCDNCACGK
jgi:hypothetical protein